MWNASGSTSGRWAARSESSALGLDGLYTPQMVIDGRSDVVGSDRAGVLSAVSAAGLAARAAVPLALSRTSDGVSVAVGAGAGGPATVLLAGFDSRHVTVVRHGENAGSTLTESNIVRGLLRAGDWRGTAVTLHAAVPPGEHLAALLQAPDGRILGAARLD